MGKKVIRKWPNKQPQQTLSPQPRRKPMHHVDLARAKPAVHMNSPLGYKMKHSPLRDNGNDEVVGSAGEIDMEKDKALRIKLGIPPYDPSGEVASWEGAMTPKNVIRMDSLKTAGGKFSDIRPIELEIMNETWDDAHHGVEGAEKPNWLRPKKPRVNEKGQVY